MEKRYVLKHLPGECRYEFDLGDATAVVDYERIGEGVVALTHTGVPESHSGQGIAAELTEAVLEDLRQRGLKVVPLCSYSKIYIARHPQWYDLLAGR